MSGVVVEPDPAVGLLLEADRGSLPFALLHGESLVAIAAWSLGESGVRQVDLGTPWSALVEAEVPVVLHDPLCPMVPPDFIAACVERARDDDVVVLGVRPVTDTVKHVDGDLLGETVDRSTLRAVASPLVLPTSVAARLTALPSTRLTDLLAVLRPAHEVVLVEAPPEGRRVGSLEDLRVLEALTAG